MSKHKIFNNGKYLFLLLPFGGLIFILPYLLKKFNVKLPTPLDFFTNKRNDLVKMKGSSKVYERMTDEEINIMHDFYFNWVYKNKSMPQSERTPVNQIFLKYDLKF
jgi:hypothetical protein